MPAQVVTQEEFAPLVREIFRLSREVKYLQSQLSEWVDNKEAVRITGVTRQTLAAEREREGTPVRWRKDGRTVLYLRKSLIDYCDAKEMAPEVLLKVS